MGPTNRAEGPFESARVDSWWLRGYYSHVFNELLQPLMTEAPTSGICPFDLKQNHGCLVITFLQVVQEEAGRFQFVLNSQKKMPFSS